MAASELKRNYDTGHCLFAIDGESDISMLPDLERGGSGDLKFSKPCCLGSTARSSDGKAFFLNGNNQWISYSGSSGGGGGDSPSPEEVEPIASNDIASLFDFGA